VSSEPVTTTRLQRGTGWARLRKLVGSVVGRREAGILVVAVALTIYFQIITGRFISGSNFITVTQLTAATAIIACGEVLLLICGEIDLSVGNTFALVPFILLFCTQADMPLPLAMIVSLAVGGVIGFINGCVTVFLKVPSFVATLGMLFLLNGLTLTITNGYPSAAPTVGQASVVLGSAPASEILWAVGILILMQLLLTRTRFGPHVIAVGGNMMGARESGVSVPFVKIASFVMAGVLAGFAGILDSFRVGSIDPLQGGTEIMFMAVAGAVIGGTALTGGSGTVVGAFLGVVVLSLLNDGFTFIGISAFAFDIILGGAILVVMVVNVYLGRLRIRRLSQ
jgi:simple sugar transport system permease protein